MNISPIEMTSLKGKVTSSIRNISEILNFRPYTASDLRELFYFLLFEGWFRFRQFLSRALLRPHVQLTALKPRASRSEVNYSGCGVGQKRSTADTRRSKDTTPYLIKLHVSLIDCSRAKTIV